MDFDQKLLLLQSQLSRRYVYTASVTSGETSSLATGLPAKPQETITRIQFNIYINQSNFLGSLQREDAKFLWVKNKYKRTNIFYNPLTFASR